MALHEAMQPNSFLGPIEPLLDVTRAAHLLGISVKTLRDWIKGRRIDYVKVGTRVMIRPKPSASFELEHPTRQADESIQTTRKLVLRLQVPVPRPEILSFDGHGKPARGRIDRGRSPGAHHSPSGWTRRTGAAAKSPSGRRNTQTHPDAR
jgi:excisionase family DNA binding protein